MSGPSIARARPALALMRLAARRTLRGIGPGLFVLALVLVWNEPTAPPRPTLLVGSKLRLPTADDVRRAGDWSIAFWCLAPLLVLHAAATAGRWPREQGIWLAARALPRRAALAAWLIGSAAAAAALLVLTLCAVEARSASSTQPQALERIQHRPLLIQGAGASARLELRGVPPQATALRVRFSTTLGPRPSDGPLARVRLTARRLSEAQGPGASAARLRGSDPAPSAGAESLTDSAGARSGAAGRAEGHSPFAPGEPRQPPAPASGSVTAAGFGRFAVDVPLAPGGAPNELFVETLGSGPACVLRGSSLEALGAPISSMRAAAGIALRCALLLLTATALAFAAGTRLGAAVAGLATLCPWIIAWTRASPPTWWPGGDLWTALEQLSEGVAPAPPTLAAGATAALAFIIALELARAALAPGADAGGGTP